MQKMGLNELRESYLSFFESKEHLRAPSFPLVPQNDASLLLINSGMAPLKPYFSGQAEPPAKRMTTCQKCVRVIDIDRVGQTDRHCTFFEMLGHFSFGDYFKREAITWTWEYFTEVLGIDPSLLYCSVYLDDDEAWDIWTKEVGVDESHMVRLGKEDNFWDIGSGPCGPCSEVYFDRGAENGCGGPDCKVGCDCDRYVEIGNNVFTQFSNDGQGNYTPLAQKNIDFGMGLERLACVVQGVDSVFGVDTITRIRRHVSDITGAEYNHSKETDVSLRIITDHIRSTVMLVCDGVFPSNEGRGYVLRRLLRRAARHGRLLGVKGAFLHELSLTVVGESRGAYPELAERRDYIRRVIKEEEERFEQTIDSGLRMLMELIERLENTGLRLLSGADAFRLYDTYGFPLALTDEILAERGMSVEREVFDGLMEDQRERARKARSALGDFAWADADLGIDKSVKTEFTGYDTLASDARVLYILTPDGPIDTAEEGSGASLILDVTPFYAESGGQVSDHGDVEGDGFSFKVADVRKTKDGQILHIGSVVSGVVKSGSTALAKVDKPRRDAIRRAHSATHLLHKALRTALGTHVGQAGSLVEPDRLRFDFTHFAALTQRELEQVREAVVDGILDGLSVAAEVMDMESAKKKGAMALFDEKYGDAVRVVEMGNWSVELCGGTHVDNTAKIGAFILNGADSSVAAGVRRIEAKVGKLALEDVIDAKSVISRVSGLMKTLPEELYTRIEQHIADGRALRNEVVSLKTAALRAEAERALTSARSVNGLRVLTMTGGWDADALRAAGDYLRDKAPDAAAVLASTLDGRLTFQAVCGKDAVKSGVRAGDIIKKLCAFTGGGGGGRPDGAMGGGGDPAKLGAALDMVDDIILALGKGGRQ
ncbi:MAG: alanine--tRNA ligase [Oscillospiraceae bacterium]|nr:alanine--tRNA ligase [Oscillospiraceae bacterium]